MSVADTYAVHQFLTKALSNHLLFQTAYPTSDQKEYYERRGLGLTRQLAVVERQLQDEVNEFIYGLEHVSVQHQGSGPT